MARAAAAMAERPSSGASPACAERPLKTTSMVFPYGAERTIPPTGPLQS
jgi:hypothetical protein